MTAQFVKRGVAGGLGSRNLLDVSEGGALGGGEGGIFAVARAGLNKEVLGMFLVGSSIREQVELEKRIHAVALAVAAAGILLGVALSGWTAARVTKPVEQLAAASRQVAAGDWNVRVEARSQDEFGASSPAPSTR